MVKEEVDVAEEIKEVETRVIEMPAVFTVGELAEKLEVPVTALIGELIKNGIMATVNEKIDSETATLVLEEFMPEIELKLLEKKDANSAGKREAKELTKQAKERPPVVAVMGHVDHGKTTLLDAIRGSKVVEGEAGGITQHISAYQIVHGDKPITFLDTPGHEAFAALRQHGANLTDMVIIVVAADDGVKPQTKEAIRFAKQAGVKMIVAINKIDKSGANINRVKQELAKEEVMIEDFGGEVIAVEVSAKSELNIDKLLDTILLVAEVEELKAEYDVPAEGLVIESHMARGKGAVATVLVEHGTLESKEFIVAGASYAKVRTMTTTLGEQIDVAGPSTPVILTGFKTLPVFSDLFKEYGSEKEARQAAEKYASENDIAGSGNLNITSTEMIRRIDKSIEQREVPVIVRADVQGSLTSVLQSLQSLEHEEVKVRIVGTGVGNISESDISMAEASGSIIYGFNVELPVTIKRQATKLNVLVKVYKIIYELIDDIKVEMSKLLEPEIVEEEIGKLLIKGVFRTTKTQIICGGETTKGKILPNAFVRIFRKKEKLGEAKITSLRKGDQEAKEVVEGDMCGMELATDKKIVVEIGDKLEFFTREEKVREI